MDSRTSRRQKRISKRQESRTAAEIGGRTQANSGATRLGGGADVRVPGNTRVECKYTEKTTFVLKKTELEKLQKQAMATLDEPIFQFAFADRLGRFDRYAVIKGFAVTEEEPHPYEMDTASKSVSLPQSYLHSCLASARIRVTFREESYAKQYEVMRWDNFLASRGQTDA
jgi:hypothetical protein